MKKQKRGISLVSLIVTILTMLIMASIIFIDFEDENPIKQAKEIVTLTRFRELENAVTRINSDYQLLEEKDATIRNISLKEYILERLREEYNLTAEEETVITVDEDGRISNATE